LLLGVLIGAGGCKSRTTNNPETIYRASQQELRRGDLKGALADADRGLLVSSDTHSDWHWRFLALKAEILVWQGLSSQSLQLLRQDFPLSLQDSETEVWRELTQASAYMDLSKFDLAAQSLAEARNIAGSKHPDLLGYVALREGTLADYQNDPEKASTLYRTSLQAARNEQDSYLEASALGSMGLVETEAEHYDASVDWNRQALRVSERAGAKSLAAKIQVNTGWSYFELGDYENALAMFEQAEQAASAAGLRKDRVICRVNIGAVDYYLRDYAGAEKNSLQALELARNLDEKRLQAESLNTLSSASITLGKINAAEEYNRDALNSYRSIGDHGGEMSTVLIAGRIEAERKHYREAENLLTRVVHDESATTATRWEAEARLAKVYDAEHLPMKAEVEYDHAVRTIEETRRSIQEDELRLSFLSSVIDLYDDYVDFLIRHGRIEEALRFADFTRSKTLAEGLAAGQGLQKEAPALHPQQLAQKLNATLLLYWVGQNHSYLWAVRSNRLICFPLPSGPEIESAANAYRRAILEGRDVLAADSTAGRQLYAMLIGPAEKLLDKNTRVIVLPGESLYSLNFETLIVPHPIPHFWIEDTTISTGSSMALLSAANQKADKRKSLLLVGNPESSDPDFPPLAQAAEEMRKVSIHFLQAQCKVIEGKQATATAYLQSNPENYSYLHFVAHGIASQTRPLESAVILSKDGDAYKLYAREIVAHPLRAQLVTISACNGAGTRAFAGEGLVGLAWAFLRAGSRNVIASLWEVSDAASTAELMDRLYAGLDQGEDPATALRNAKLSLLKSNQGTVFHKPFYWAPFQLFLGS
jgi:CHAT domain-containing protein